MQTECSAERSMFGRVEGRSVVAEFDGGVLTSDAGGLLLGAADRRLDLVRRIARCFRDARDPRLVEHSVATLIGQRVFGMKIRAWGHQKGANSSCSWPPFCNFRARVPRVGSPLGAPAPMSAT